MVDRHVGGQVRVNGAESVTVESDAVDVGQLMHAVDSYAAALAHQRGRLRTALQTADEPVARRQ